MIAFNYIFLRVILNIDIFVDMNKQFNYDEFNKETNSGFSSSIL